jgi:hypothetical protein
METINPAQLKKLHYLLNRLGWMDEKKTIISQITSGRTQSSRELSFEEGKELLKQLSEYDPAERMKSLIFSLAYRANIIYGSTGLDKKLNAVKLNQFLKERGAVKKDLNAMDYPELIKTHKQFEAIVKNVARAADNKQASKLVAGLIGELNINVLTC